MPGLMAFCEAACVSVDGAIRLGTYSLLYIVDFGRAAAHRAAEIVIPHATSKRAPLHATDKAIARFDRMRNANGSKCTASIRLEMQHAMQRLAAVFRSSESLERGVGTMDQIAGKMGHIGVADKSLIWNTDLIEALELENLMGQALVSIRSAAQRQESRGAHALSLIHI